MYTFGLRTGTGEAGTVLYDQLEVELVDCLEAAIDDESVEVVLADEELEVVLDDTELTIEVCD